MQKNNQVALSKERVQEIQNSVYNIAEEWDKAISSLSFPTDAISPIFTKEMLEDLFASHKGPDFLMQEDEYEELKQKDISELTFREFGLILNAVERLSIKNIDDLKGMFALPESFISQHKSLQKMRDEMATVWSKMFVPTQREIEKKEQESRPEVEALIQKELRKIAATTGTVKEKTSKHNPNRKHVQMN